MSKLKPFIKIPNPNPARYGNWKSMKAGLKVEYIPEAKQWFASYGTRGEIGTVKLSTGHTMQSALNKLKELNKEDYDRFTK